MKLSTAKFMAITRYRPKFRALCLQAASEVNGEMIVPDGTWTARISEAPRKAAMMPPERPCTAPKAVYEAEVIGEDAIAARQAVCIRCDQYVVLEERCKKCPAGCLRKRMRAVAGACPEGLWPA
jgi:hypothetical protein